ncbi:hypothetical protein IscW_ISCW010815, partial [Ixodes scapularis]
MRGEVKSRDVTVLRDSGCNTVVGKNYLVPDHKLTGVLSPVFFLDRAVKYLPEAKIDVKTPNVTGSIVALCMGNRLYDLVLVNVAGVRRINDPDGKSNDKKGPKRFKENTEEAISGETTQEGETAERLVKDERNDEQGCEVFERRNECAGSLESMTRLP